jgi:methylmalonyl-CoA mutase cobalamin-binding domain/chain
VLVDTLLEGRCAGAGQEREYLRLIAGENQRLTRLIDNFLNFSRMERNRHAFEFAEVKPEEIVRAALEEDVDLIGLSILSGAHMALFPKVLALLKKEKAADIPVFAGGIIPDEDARRLKKAGIRAIFGPGTTLKEIVSTAEMLARGAA